MNWVTYPGVEVRGAAIRMTFHWQGQRCRETLALCPTPANLKQAARLRAEILQKIAIDAFDYAEFFPESKRLCKLGLTPQTLAPTFWQLSQQWLGFKRDECQLSTVKGYEDALRKHLLPALGSRPIDTLIYSELAGLVATLACKHAKTRNNILTPLRGVFELGLRDGLITDNPARHLRNRRLQQDRPDPFERFEMERIVAGFALLDNELMRNYFEFAFTSGLRTSELIALRWCDVDFVGRVVHVRQARVRNQTKMTKTYRAREIELTERALNVLTRQFAQSFTDEMDTLVFVDSMTGEGFRDDRVQRERYWYPLLDRLGIRRRPAYNTRHTFSTLALLAGADPMWVAHQLGHANMRLLLETYSRWIDRSDAGRNRDKLSVLFSAAPHVPHFVKAPVAISNEINALN